MKIRAFLAVAVLLAVTAASPPSFAAPPSTPGRIHHPVSSRSPEAQALFDQGLFHIFAFNHDEAVRSFQQALKLDPDFAMAYWGIALALGPNINLEADPPRQKAAFEAISKAIALSAALPEQEKAYIQALATRYTGKPDEDLPQLAKSYRSAMKSLWQRYPDDPDAATLYAESIMDLRPWKLWSADGRPAEDTPELVSVLESVLRRHPLHVGANHYYIHAIEASPHPERGLPSAERLKALQLPAGHLVHMPAHIYMRTGDYHSASLANQAAAAADEAYLKSGSSTGIYPLMYYSHNLHFLAVSRGLEGNFKEAMAAADRLAGHVGPHVAEVPMLELFMPTPALVLARFQKWPEILRLPEPPSRNAITASVWHFTRGLAYARTGELEKAKAERVALVYGAERISPEVMLEVNRARDIINIGWLYLDAEIARASGDLAGAAANLKKGVAAEDALSYTEPPSWYLPLREPLGGLLLQMKDYPGAEKVFREELVKNPRSGRALFGLWQSLKGQGKDYEAAWVRREFENAWSYADIDLDKSTL